MAQAIRNIPIGSWVKDTATLHNGIPIRWKVMNHDHRGYPSNTTTLMAVPDQSSPIDVRVYYSYRDSSKETFRDVDVDYNGERVMVGSILDGMYESFSEGLKKVVIETPLQIGYTGNYTAREPRYREETHKLFLMGAGEINHGIGKFLSNHSSQERFYGLSAYSNIGIGNYLGIGQFTKVMSRDIGVSNSHSFDMYPGYISRQQGNQINNNNTDVQINPIINISSDTIVSDTPESDGAYLLDLVMRLNLIEKDGKLLTWNHDSSDWKEVGETPLTESVFLDHGFSDLSTVPKEKWREIGSNIQVHCYSDVGDKMKVGVSTPASIYDSANLSYKGVGVVETEVEEILHTTQSLWISAEHQNCSFQYSRDNGTSWHDAELDKVIDISGHTGNQLIIRVHLPSTDSELTALAYGWA